MNLENGTIIGRYKILARLGAGGMGEVYLAEDTRLDRRVALKILPPEFATDKDRMSRFVREAKSASALNHPNIITIYEIGENGGAHFIATEFIDGKTLFQYVKANPLDYKSALEIAIQIASALEEAHRAGIVHRDIKPDNIMIRENGLVKILDFGIAKLTNANHHPDTDGESATVIKGTSPGMIIGTANYMSPEQAAGKTVDSRSDIFSFGVVLYEMIAGRLPFAGETAMEMIGAILKDKPLPLGASVPAELKTIAGKCLRKDLRERYQSVKEVFDDLKEFKQELEFQDKLEHSTAPHREEQKTQILKAQATAEEKHATAETRSENSILVLPFTNISTDEENEYFSDGLTEELISDLSKIRALRVISRNSAMRLKGTTKDTKTIADELHVRYILDGSVRKAGQSLRISVQLIDGERDTNLWSEKYTGTLEDIFEMQESVSRSIVEALKITLSAAEREQMAERPIADARAYDLYLRARAKLMQGSPAALDRSIELLKQGLEIIGDNELLYAALGYTYYFYFKWISKLDENYLRLANECMQKVFALNPDSTYGYSLKGFLSYSEGNVAEAVRSLKKAVEIDPNNAEALLWLTIYSQYFEGSNAEAIEYAKQAWRLDPLLPANTWVRAFVHIYGGDFGAEPLSWLERGLAMDASTPLSLWLATIGKAWCAKTDEAIAHADRLAEIAPGWVYTEHALFLKHALRGEKESALAHYTPDFEKEAEYDSHFALHVAHCFALIGEKEKALDFLETSVRKGMLNYSFIGKYDPLLENIRHEQRFKDLIEGAKKLSAQINGKSADLEIQDNSEEAGTLIIETTPEKSKALTTGSEEGFWVAVLPFKYRGGNADLEDLAEGLSEGIVTGLSRFSYLRVIARSSTLHFTSEAADIRAVGKELGARYVMEGSLRKAGAMLRVAVHLVDAATGAHLWAENYERSFNSEGIFQLQDDLVPRIVSTCADQYGALVHSMSESLRGKGVGQYSAHEAVLRAFGYWERVTPDEHREAREILEAAVAVSPNHSNCQAMLATLYWQEYVHGYNLRPDPLGRALTAAQRAIAVAPTNHLAHYALATVLFFQKDFPAFRAAAERVFALNRMDASITVFLGVLLAYAGNWEYGLEIVERARQLNPHHPGWYHLAAYYDAYNRRDYHAALETALKINMPDYYWVHVARAAVYGQLGEQERARAALRELHALMPDFGAMAREELGKWFDVELTEHLIDGLRKAGLKIAADAKAPEPKTQILQADTTPGELPPEGETQNSIAVLPFTNISADEENEYFCDGLAEELLNALSKIEDLRVAARTSAFSFKGKNANVSEIGKALNVNTILEGSVRKSGNKLRITVQLINASNGFHLWSERYDREMKDIFDVQDEITLAVVDALKVNLFGDEKAALLKRYTENTEAYELYLKGRFFWSKLSPAGLEKAIEYFSQAALIEPNFALAYAGLADSYTVLSQVSAVPESETMPKAREFAEKALSLDADLVEAHTSLGLVFADYDYDFAAAEKHYQAAIRLNPNNASAHHLYGQLLAELGRHQEAEAELRQAIKIDPLSVVFNWQYGFVLFQARRYDEAILQLEKTAEMDSGFLLTQWAFACIHQAQGNYAAAAESFAKFYELAGNSADAVRVRKSFADGGWTGFVRMMTGGQRPADVTGYLAAILHASLGEKDAAFAKLETAYEKREWLLALIKIDPRIDSLRDDRRFAEMLNRIGFAPEKANQTDEIFEAKTLMLSSSKSENDLEMGKADFSLISEQTTNPQSAIPNPKSKWWLFGLLGLLLLLVGGFFGYRYFTSSKQIESIAVLPFENGSGDPNLDYLSDGVSESVIDRLSQLPQLKVIARSSSFRYRGQNLNLQEIANALGVQAIVTGRVVPRGDSYIVRVDVTDVRENKQLWGENFSRKASDVQILQADISREIAENLKLRLSGTQSQQFSKEGTANPQAYEAFVKGLFFLNKPGQDNANKAVEHFEQAVAADPNYALAWSNLANAYAVGGGKDLDPKERHVKRRMAAEKAVELAPNLADAHYALGQVKINDWEWAEAERESKLAIELNPNLAKAHSSYQGYLVIMGRYDEAIAAAKRSVELDPVDYFSATRLSTAFHRARRYDETIETVKRVIEMEPNHFFAHLVLADAYAAKGMYQEAIAEYQESLRLGGANAQITEASLGVIYVKMGERAKAEKILASLKSRANNFSSTPIDLSLLYDALGMRDEAFAILEKAYAERAGDLGYMRTNPKFDNLRPDPRFKDLLRRMNLPE